MRATFASHLLLISVIGGAGVGTGLWKLLIFHSNPTNQLRIELEKIEGIEIKGNSRLHSMKILLSNPIVTLLGNNSKLSEQMICDAQLVNKKIADVATQSAVWTILGFCFPLFLSVLKVFTNLGLSINIACFMALVASLSGLVLPWYILRKEAAETRTSYLESIGTFLNIVELNLASGKGLEEAVNNSVDLGRSGIFALMKNSITESVDSGVPIWEGLSNLGEKIGLSELSEIGATLNLSGSEGAKIRESISQKSQAQQKELLKLLSPPLIPCHSTSQH